RRLGVATIAEGVELRQVGVTAPILVMGGGLSDGLTALLEYDLTPVLTSPDCIASLVRLASGRSSPLPVHLKIDTGMGRLGFSPKEAVSLLDGGWPPALQLEGLMSHLASGRGGYAGHRGTARPVPRSAGACQAARYRYSSRA